MSEEDRSQSIVNNVQKLIKCLSGAECTEARLRIKEQKALRTIGNHNFLKTNSHEVRRTVDNMVDRLEYEGLKDFAVAVQAMSSKIFDHPDWEGQYEMDAQYAMVDFLFAMTHRPIQNIRNNIGQMHSCLQKINAVMDTAVDGKDGKSPIAIVKPNSSEENIDWTALLSEDFISISSSQCTSNDDSESTLSDWSETSEIAECSQSEFEMENKTSLKSPDMAEVYSKSMTYPRGTNTYVSDSVLNVPESGSSLSRKSNFSITIPTILSFSGINCPRRNWCTQPELPPLKEPQVLTPYTQCEFDPENLLRTTHSDWWRDDIQVYTQTPTNDPCSNFAIAYVQHLNRVSRGLIKHPLPKTISETALVREIIFMFMSPVSCGFFKVESIPTQYWEQKRISVRRNVSIPKASSDTLFNFLEVEILPAMQAMQKLRETINEQTPQADANLYPGTLESFAFGLRDLIEPIIQRIIAFERLILEETMGTESSSGEDQQQQQKEGDYKSRTTLISFVQHMREDFRKLLHLQSLASKAVIDAPSYMRSIYLLSQLYKQTKNGSSDKKVATALLLISLRTYCNIIDNWWRHNNLNDSEQEYIVELSNDESVPIGNRISARLPTEDVNDLCVDHNFIRELRRCEFYQMLVNYALEAGETQLLLFSVNLLGDLRQAYRDIQPLYDDLAKQLREELRPYIRNADVPRNVTTRNSDEQEAGNEKLRQYDAKVLDGIAFQGNIEIMSILTMHITQPLEEKAKPAPHSETIDVLNSLEECIEFLPPCMLARALDKVLHVRCQLASRYVMRWFHEDLQLSEHVRFLRHIMLMEADYVLFPFYTKLFQCIETGQRWANSALLTVDLHERLDTRYPSKACLLYIRLKSEAGPKSTKVYAALDDLDMEYEMSLPLQRVINQQQMRQYNQIWRFMLKVKWAAWKLDNMRFIRRSCNDAFAPLDLLGLTLRRLEILRFWLFYVINNLHSHLCTYVVQTLGEEFEQQIRRANRIRDLDDTHKEYINKIFKHCLLTDDFADFRKAIDQVFHLVFVLEMEWNSCCSYLNESHALSPDMSMEAEEDLSLQPDDLGRQKALEYIALNDIVEIEHTYIRCHQLLGTLLTSLVYEGNHKFLNSLEVAINSSIPN